MFRIRFHRKNLAVKILFSSVSIFILSACTADQDIIGQRYSENPDMTETPEPTPEPIEYVWDKFYAEAMALNTDERQARVDEFIEEIENSEEFGFPLVQETKAVFIYTGNSSGPPNIAGDFTGWDPSITMQSIPYTSLWYHVREFPKTARLDYKYVVNGNWINDGRNPRRVTGGYGPNSEIVMPDFVDPPEIEVYDDIEHGTIESFNFYSTVRDNNRFVRVYLPPGYDENGNAYPTVFVLDGGDYYRLAEMNNVLDYCIANNICEPVVAVFVDPVNRTEEYWLNDSFEQFFVEEMVPHINENYNVADDASRRCIMGASLGGVTSVQLSYNHPDIFGLAGCHSSALWINSQEMIDIVADGPAVNVDYYLDVGHYEGEQYLADSRRLFQILRGKGNKVQLREFPDGHSWGNWRGHIDDILMMHFPVSGKKK